MISKLRKEGYVFTGLAEAFKQIMCVHQDTSLYLFPKIQIIEEVRACESPNLITIYLYYIVQREVIDAAN